MGLTVRLLRRRVDADADGWGVLPALESPGYQRLNPPPVWVPAKGRGGRQTVISIALRAGIEERSLLQRDADDGPVTCRQCIGTALQHAQLCPCFHLAQLDLPVVANGARSQSKAVLLLV